MDGSFETVWVFNGEKPGFSGGIFSSRENAERWILKNHLSGVLTEYPVDVGIFDWAATNGYFQPKRADQTTPEFIGRFTSSRQQHYHYEEGQPF